MVLQRARGAGCRRSGSTAWRGYIHNTFDRAFRVPDDTVNRERAPDIIIIIEKVGEAWNEAVGRGDAEVVCE